MELLRTLIIYHEKKTNPKIADDKPVDQLLTPSIFDSPEVTELKGILREIMGKMEEVNPEATARDMEIIKAEKEKAEAQKNIDSGFGKFTEDLANVKKTVIVNKKKQPTMVYNAGAQTTVEKVLPVSMDTSGDKKVEKSTEPESLLGKRTMAEVREEDQQMVKEGLVNAANGEVSEEGNLTKRPCGNKEN